MTKSKVQGFLTILAIIALNFVCLWLNVKDLPDPGKALSDAGVYGLLFAAGNTVGYGFNWLGKKSRTKTGLIFWLAGGAVLSLAGIWALTSLARPDMEQWLATYLIGYLFSNAFVGFSASNPNYRMPVSLMGEERTFLLGTGLGLGLLVLCSLFRLVDLFMAWAVWLGVILPGSLYILYNNKRMAVYAEKRQHSIEQNPQLIALFRQLGDGVEYDSVKCQATFKSQASVETFQQSAPGWKVELAKGKQ